MLLIVPMTAHAGLILGVGNGPPNATTALEFVGAQPTTQALARALNPPSLTGQVIADVVTDIDLIVHSSGSGASYVTPDGAGKRFSSVTFTTASGIDLLGFEFRLGGDPGEDVLVQLYDDGGALAGSVVSTLAGGGTRFFAMQDPGVSPNTVTISAITVTSLTDPTGGTIGKIDQVRYDAVLSGSINVLPEPSSLGIWAIGCIGIAGIRRRRR